MQAFAPAFPSKPDGGFRKGPSRLTPLECRIQALDTSSRCRAAASTASAACCAASARHSAASCYRRVKGSKDQPAWLGAGLHAIQAASRVCYHCCCCCCCCSCEATLIGNPGCNLPCNVVRISAKTSGHDEAGRQVTSPSSCACLSDGSTLLCYAKQHSTFAPGRPPQRTAPAAAAQPSWAVGRRQRAGKHRNHNTFAVAHATPAPDPAGVAQCAPAAVSATTPPKTPRCWSPLIMVLLIHRRRHDLHACSNGVLDRRL